MWTRQYKCRTFKTRASVLDDAFKIMLFCLIVRHSYVPGGFGRGYIIPLVKDKFGNLNDANNYDG